MAPPSPAVPCPNLYAQLNALQLVLDPRSLVWLNLFALDLRQSLEQFMEIYKLSDSQKPDEHVDIKVDGLMLKVRRTAGAVFRVFNVFTVICARLVSRWWFPPIRTPPAPMTCPAPSPYRRQK